MTLRDDSKATRDLRQVYIKPHPGELENDIIYYLTLRLTYPNENQATLVVAKSGFES